MFRIGNVHHSESKSVWYVTDTDRDEVVATLQLMQVRKSAEGACYRLLGVQPGNRVRVQRCDRGHDDISVWNVYSFIVMPVCSVPIETL